VKEEELCSETSYGIWIDFSTTNAAIDWPNETPIGIYFSTAIVAWNDYDCDDPSVHPTTRTTTGRIVHVVDFYSQWQYLLL